jgi:hypothetical protein
MSGWGQTDRRILVCADCGSVIPGAATNDGDFAPIGGADGGSCHNCGGEEFEPAALWSE